MAFSFPKPTDRLVINNSVPTTRIPNIHQLSTNTSIKPISMAPSQVASKVNITPSNQYGWTVPTDKQSGQGSVPHFQHKTGDSVKCSVSKTIVNNAITDTFNPITPSSSGLGGAFEQMMLNTQLKQGIIQVNKHCN